MHDRCVNYGIRASARARERNILTDRQTGRQTDRQTETETERQIGRDRDRNRQADRERDTGTQALGERSNQDDNTANGDQDAKRMERLVISSC